MALRTAHDARLVNGDLPSGFADFVTGAEAIAQRIWIRLGIHKGEWFADTSRGVPWIAWMSTSMTPGLQSIIEQTLREEVSTVPGVQTARVRASRDDGSETMAISIEAYLENEVLELEYAVSQTRYGNVNPRISQRLSRTRAIRS